MIEKMSFVHSNIKSIPANLTAFKTYMSNVSYDFSITGFTETWLNLSNIETYGIDGYSHVGLNTEIGKGEEFRYLYVIKWCVVKCQNLL